MEKEVLIYTAYYESPIGIVEIKSNEDAIIGIDFVDKIGKRDEMIPILAEAYNQIDEYFKGKRKNFDLKLSIEGTEFQKKVWMELTKIPYGEVATYKDVAIRVGNEKAVRAVGNSNNKNKIAIILPCHRVIGSNGKLVGYAGGIHVKEWLLNHERKFK